MRVAAQEHFKLAMIYEGLDFSQSLFRFPRSPPTSLPSATSSRPTRSSTGSMASR